MDDQTTETDFEQLLRAADLRVTRPRLAVLRALGRHPHADTGSVLAAVRTEEPTVSHQAVYDVLGVLNDSGLVRRIQPAGSVARYELRVDDNHHHVVCRSCGTVADVDCAVGVPPLPRRLRHPRLRRRRGRGHRLGPVPRLRHPPSTIQQPRDTAHRELPKGTPCPTSQDETRRPRARKASTARPSPAARVMHDSATAEGSESENPVHRLAPAEAQWRPHTNQDWWPNQARPLGAARPLGRRATPWAPTSRTPTPFAQLDVESLKSDIAQTLRKLAGLVARRLRPLRRPDDPDELALRGHLPRAGRPRRRRRQVASGSRRSTRWPDNANLDKARRLLWPVKQKYGQKVSWADLIAARGQRRARGHGLRDLRLRLRPRGRVGARGSLLGSRGHAGSGDERYAGERALSDGLGAVQWPDRRQPPGPHANPDPVARALDIRETFARMAMNDEETVALIAGGYTFGKTHGNGDADP